MPPDIIAALPWTLLALMLLHLVWSWRSAVFVGVVASLIMVAQLVPVQSLAQFGD
ncbi:hypothetical protein [Rhodopseudomonas palustris]|uniref:hypothetical protein n=1 Tax=Rhodopseudomonas palustris TaxID=1076 RepID=UPI00163DBD21|nr:hypothetical protein [Rhodopseudomonas palustris]